MDSLGLDQLVLIPTGVAPHKRIEPEPGPPVRLELARLAARVRGISVSDLEVDREGPSFAYRTLELLADELPGSELIFVMGADVAAGLESWRRPERVLELARIAVAERPGIERADVDATLGRLGAARGQRSSRCRRSGSPPRSSASGSPPDGRSAGSSPSRCEG